MIDLHQFRIKIGLFQTQAINKISYKSFCKGNNRKYSSKGNKYINSLILLFIIINAQINSQFYLYNSNINNKVTHIKNGNISKNGSIKMLHINKGNSNFENKIDDIYINR